MFSKTPVVTQLRDENAPGLFGTWIGKPKGTENVAVHKKKNAAFEKHAFVTPVGPRSRAPLGMKTTNAKIVAFQTPAGSILQKDTEAVQPKTTSVRRQRKVIHAESIKIATYGNEAPLSEPDVEYCPPTPKDLPYESDTFPDNCLDYSHIQPHNLTRDLYVKNNISHLEPTGLTKLEIVHEEAYQRDVKHMDDAVLKMMEERWSIEDELSVPCHQKSSSKLQLDKSQFQGRSKVPFSSSGPTALSSKKASAALSMAPKPISLERRTPKPTPKSSFPGFPRKKAIPKLAAPSSRLTTACYSTSNITSRSTIGYSKGRDVPKILLQPKQTLHNSERQDKCTSTKTGSRTNPENTSLGKEYQSPSFLSIFNEDDENLEPGLCGTLPNCVRYGEEDEEFIITL